MAAALAASLAAFAPTSGRQLSVYNWRQALFRTPWPSECSASRPQAAWPSLPFQRPRADCSPVQPSVLQEPPPSGDRSLTSRRNKPQVTASRVAPPCGEPGNAAPDPRPFAPLRAQALAAFGLRQCPVAHRCGQLTFQPQKLGAFGHKGAADPDLSRYSGGWRA